MKRNLKLNKTGSQQCTRAVCSTFTEIQSTVTPRCIDTLFRVRIPFQSLAQSLKSNPDSSPPFQSPVHVYTSHSPIFILRLQKRPVFLLHLALFRLVGPSAKRKIIEPSLTAFTGSPFALVFIVRSRRKGTFHSRASVSLTVFSI